MLTLDLTNAPAGMLRLLVEPGPEGRTVGRIGEVLGLPSATLSFHLSARAAYAQHERQELVRQRSVAPVEPVERERCSLYSSSIGKRGATTENHARFVIDGNESPAQHLMDPRPGDG